jgi:nucleoside phosphorylase
MVGTVLNQMGNPASAQQTERLLQTFGADGPGLVVVLGIAGRLDDDLRLGDVVVADQVTNYGVRSKVADADGSGVDDGDSENERPEAEDDARIFGNSSMSLIDWQPGGVTRHVGDEVTEAVARLHSAHADQVEEWKRRTHNRWDELVDERDLVENDIGEEMYDPPPTQETAPVASGGLVVASRYFSRRLALQNRNFAAVEMEAAGVMEVLRRTPGVSGLVVRGISDFADADKDGFEDSDTPWRTCAVYSAAEYLKAFLDAGLYDAAVSDSGRQAVGPATRRCPTSETLAATAVEATGTGGPATNFVRRHPLGGLGRYASATDESGQTIALEVNLQPDVGLPIRSAEVQVETDDEPTTPVSRRVAIDGRRIPLESEETGRFATRQWLPADTATTVRLEKTGRRGSSRLGKNGIETPGSEPVDVELRFQLATDTEATSHWLVVRGQLTSSQGLLVNKSSIERTADRPH